MQARPRPAALAALAGLVLVVAAMLVPLALSDDVRVHFPPLHAWWGPRFKPLLLVAIALGVALWLWLPGLSRRLSWGWTVVVATVSGWLWTVALGLSDGRYGFARVYERKGEYLYDAVRVDDVRATLAGFVDRIPMDAPDNWHVHVAGHPPGALLSFVGLDRVGIDDPFWVGMAVVTAGATAVAAVLLTLAELGSRDVARRAAPWLVLAPAVVWGGSSGDWYFAAVAAWGLYFLARSAVRGSWPSGVVAGLLLGWCVFLSYGLVLLGVPALVVLWLARTWRPLPFAVGGALVVAATFSALGFHWWEAYPVLRERYYDGIASERAYGYWVWANVAAWTFTVGLATWAAFPTAFRAASGAVRALPGPLRGRVGSAVDERGVAVRAAEGPRDEGVVAEVPGGRRGEGALALLAGGALTSILLATLSGMSKAEVERIWLPFTVWVLTLPALLPDRWQRPLLASQVVVGVLAQTLLITRW